MILTHLYFMCLIFVYFEFDCFNVFVNITFDNELKKSRSKRFPQAAIHY